MKRSLSALACQPNYLRCDRGIIVSWDKDGIIVQPSVIDGWNDLTYPIVVGALVHELEQLRAAASDEIGRQQNLNDEAERFTKGIIRGSASSAVKGQRRIAVVRDAAGRFAGFVEEQLSKDSQ